MEDLVSVIMPSYNTANYIGKSIESVLNQTYQNWELIIVDDCSVDNTDEIVNKFLKDKRIKYLKNNKNNGAAISRNRAIKKARGKYIAFLDSDDLWEKNKLKEQIKFMKKNNYAFTYSYYEEIDEDGNKLNTRVLGPRKITKTGMYNYCWPGCLTVIYEVERIGLIQIKNIKKNNDYAMWLKIIKKSNCYLYPHFLAFYRKRSGSISRQNFITLIKWHYKLFKEADEQNNFNSLIFTIRNLFFGMIKKIKYKRKFL